MTAFAIKTESLYFACSPELGLISYGDCQDEALNNLQDELRNEEGRNDRHVQ